MIRFHGFPPSRRQAGVALIMVLLAMALVVMLAIGMLQQQNLRIFKAGHYLAQQQGYSVALGTEDIARQYLVNDFKDDKENGMVDNLREKWAQYSAVLPLDDIGVAEVQIDDLGGRINLNDLVTSAGTVNELTRGRLDRLLQNLGITTIKVDVLIDWIDSNDQTISIDGAEDGQYLLQEPSYRAGNQPFTSVSELRLIAGLTPEDYETLAPYVAALPVSGLGINVNTAEGPVIQSLHQELSQDKDKVVSILERRQEEPFEDLQAFLALPEFSGLGLKPEGLSLQTRFFEVVSRITYDNRTINLVSTVFRNPEGKVLTVRRDSGQKDRIYKDPSSIPEE